MIAVREYDSAADMIAARRALRAKFYGLPVNFEREPAPVPDTAPAYRPLIAGHGPDQIRDWLNLADPNIYRPSPWRLILTEVSLSTGVSILDMQSERRQARLVLARQIAAFLMRRHTVLSLPSIGYRLGGRDHTTILHACRQIEKRIAADCDFQALIECLSANIMAKAEQ
jgi:hypothetical protein